MNLNTLIIAGKLTRDIELRFTPKGTAIAKMGVALNRTWKNEAGEKMEDVTFVDVDVFGRTAENCNQYLKKGSPVLIQGRLKMDTWDDKQSGQKRSKLSVVAENVQFGGAQRQSEQPGGASQPPNERDSNPPGRPGGSLEEGDDVPF